MGVTVVVLGFTIPHGIFIKVCLMDLYAYVRWSFDDEGYAVFSTACGFNELTARVNLHEGCFYRATPRKKSAQYQSGQVFSHESELSESNADDASIVGASPMSGRAVDLS